MSYGPETMDQEVEKKIQEKTYDGLTVVKPVLPMSSPEDSQFHPHRHDPKIKGCTVDYRDRCKFLPPGSTFADMRGREYLVAEDGSLRRLKKDK